MNSTGKYDFRQFQEELAALERQSAGRTPPAPAPAPPPPEPKAPPEPKRRGRPPKVDPLAEAKVSFEALRVKHSLTVADVVSWFPEEEGIAYLQALIASAEPKPRKRRTPKATPDSE
jgi:hypothetical protein